jgi:hypothetical protein
VARRRIKSGRGGIEDEEGRDVTEGTASKASHFDDDEMRYMRREVLKTRLDDDEMLRALRREAMRLSLVEAMRLSLVEAMRLSRVSCVSHASHSQTQLAESPETRGVLRREALISKTRCDRGRGDRS